MRAGEASEMAARRRGPPLRDADIPSLGGGSAAVWTTYPLIRPPCDQHGAPGPGPGPHPGLVIIALLAAFGVLAAAAVRREKGP